MIPKRTYSIKSTSCVMMKVALHKSNLPRLKKRPSLKSTSQCCRGILYSQCERTRSLICSRVLQEYLSKPKELSDSRCRKMAARTQMMISTRSRNSGQRKKGKDHQTSTPSNRRKNKIEWPSIRNLKRSTSRARC